jgi:PAS domain S-box-containing protein
MSERRFHDRRRRPSRRHQDSLAGVGDRRHVLIVEPNDDTRLLYAVLFEEAGYAVSAAADGRAAIAIVPQTLPDVIVMEMVVPGADGFEILQRSREASLTTDIPVIVVTASLHFDVPARARASGAVLVLAKPTSVDALLSAVDDVMTAVPREKLARRRLMRALLMIRTFAKRCAVDADAQQRIRSIIDRLQVAVLAIDEHGRCVAASRGATTITGYSRTQLLEKSVFDTTFGTGLPLAQPWQEAQPDRSASADVAIQNASGKSIPVHLTFDSIFVNLHAAAIVAK